LAVVMALPPGALTAQARNQVTVIRSGDPNLPDLDVRTVRRHGFDLFGSGDAAHAGMRMTGGWGSSISNYGDCSNLLTYCQSQQVVATRNGNSYGMFFHLEWTYGTPPHEWLKLRQAHEGAGTAIGGGFMANAGEMFINRPYSFGPQDGTLGVMFSGVTATDDGSCQDHTGFLNGNFYENVVGLQLLPTSDCPPTWGSDGWRGAHPVDQAGYKVMFDALGHAFQFDFWQVPDSLQRLDKLFLGTGFHTYGESSDYPADQLVRYGEVVPGGVGAPQRPGYPLGLLVHYDAFNFAVPTVASVKYVQEYIINRSQDVWGTPIDFDSLYFGMSQGTLFNSQGISMYAVPELGLVLFHEDAAKGASGPCGQSARTATGGCGAFVADDGYGDGAAAVIVLKSPLGDLRNKLFTRTPSGAPCTVGVDPFCDPTHPLAGDTMTFNQNKFGGFNGADAATWGYTQRAAFGYLSATEANTLDGRSPADIPSWSTFRNVGFPAVQGVFNKFVPGVGTGCKTALGADGCGSVWDWNHDLVPDTLALDTCGPLGCAQISSDTLASGYVNTFGNIGGVIAAGPFPLAAGDTAAWVYAIVADGDSTKVWSQINAAIDLYLNFYLAPESPPRASVISTVVEPASDELGTAAPSLTFTWSDDPEKWVDPFLAKVADDISSAPPGTPLGDLLLANPGLDTQVRERSRDNLESIEIYKSCDGGDSFTADDDCDGEPAVDEQGNAVAFGWQAYETFEVDGFTDGNPPNSFTDGDVEGGRTYLYAVVGKSRGAKFLVTTPSGPDSIVFAPGIRNVLSRSTSDPNVASVYVPAGRPAGYQAARADFTLEPIGPTVPFEILLSDAVAERSYRAVFGNEILIGRDSSISEARPLGTLVVVRRVETVDVSGVGVDSVIRTESFRYTSTDLFPYASVPDFSSSQTIGDTLRSFQGYANLGYVLVGPDGPIYGGGGDQLRGSNATPTEAFTRSAFPRFVVSTDQSLAGSFNTNGERQLRGAASIAELGLSAEDTVVPRNIVNGFMVQWLENVATRASDAGVYEVTWRSDPWGTQRGFTMNRANPAATEAEVAAALTGRPVAATGLTDAATAALLGVPLTDLVPIAIPFTIRNVSSQRDVQVAMRTRTNDRLRLGFGADTISVQLPADQWAPGDDLYLIEDVTQEKRTGVGLVLDASGQPVDTTISTASFTRAVLGCNPGGEVLTNRCNPLASGQLGAHGYNPMRDGDRSRYEYYVGSDATSEYQFDVVPAVAGSAIRSVTDSAMALVKVVPNPYVVFSQYQTSLTEGRLLFTGVPPTGTLRIYTVAGQFVQEITWTPDDLVNDGDLFWNLQTREGIDAASGLYLWVMTAPSDPADAASAPVHARGKFVIIRGDTR
jgi:hypothetical protein